VSPSGDQKLPKEQLRDRVKDVALEAAQNAPEKARELSGVAIEAAREAAQNAPERVRELRKAAAELDLPWARSFPARWVRENFMRFILNPTMGIYAARKSDGFETLAALDQPVILVANHASHLDTPVILAALPRKLRKHTAVAAAADYFYKSKLIASLASLIFNTVPLDRKGGGGGLAKTAAHLDTLLNDGWSLLIYPEGSRKHGDGLGRIRRGAAVLASEHNLPIVPIRVDGTAEAMPPGQFWPKRLRGRLFSKRHKIHVSFGEPIPPQVDTAAMIERVQNFFESGQAGPPSRTPYTRRKSADNSDE
jgi:1-acyl-sn-glycerol-3-phosphate acyltransferase